MCKEVESMPKIYKTKMSLSIEPIWQECYLFTEAVADDSLKDNQAYGLQNFSLKNLWYFDSSYMTNALCSTWPCEVTWLKPL